MSERFFFTTKDMWIEIESNLRGITNIFGLFLKKPMHRLLREETVDYII